MASARNIGLYVMIISALFIPAYALSAETDEIRTGKVKVVYEKSMAKAAEEVASVYPYVRDRIAETFGREIRFESEVVLTRNREAFRKVTGSDKILAFAVPGQNLIVLDVTRVYTKPFTLETTLRHELCHLLLHHNIERDSLPRWIDEGVCQWASGGIAELMSEGGKMRLTAAAVSDRLIPLSQLERFPRDDDGLLLAYEESKSFVEFVIREYGKDSMLTLLGDIQDGMTIDESTQKRFSMTLHELEKNWGAQLKRKSMWFSYLSNNLYAVLFLFAALLTVYGFLRFLKKKREYVDEEEGESR
jgi:hypothetical protein